MTTRVPASERTSQRLRELLNGLGDDEVGSQVIRLGIRRIVEEALEAELRDVVGRGYYEGGAMGAPSPLFRLLPGQRRGFIARRCSRK